MNSIRPDAGVIWVDFSKFGRLQNEELNSISEAVRVLLQHLPSKLVAVLVVPVLPSAKVANGIRGEVRILSLSS